MQRNDPANMSIDDRIDEVATILAAGFLRLKRRTGCLPPDISEPPGSATFESAGSSKIPADWPCHLSETSPSCASALTVRDRGLGGQHG